MASACAVKRSRDTITYFCGFENGQRVFFAIFLFSF